MNEEKLEVLRQKLIAALHEEKEIQENSTDKIKKQIQFGARKRSFHNRIFCKIKISIDELTNSPVALFFILVGSLFLIFSAVDYGQIVGLVLFSLGLGMFIGEST